MCLVCRIVEIMAAESSKSSSSADSYIGSLISLTSKSDIRYEGVLYSINTEESSIGLRNVRSFGSEGRKKDGPQIPPSDRVYEFILFRGTDIKDLQVKSTPPAQTASTIENDPAIIQSHYPRPPAPSTNVPPAVSVSPADVNSHTPQMGHPGSNFPGGMPLYHHGASLGSWGPSLPSSINGNPIPMPAYWPGMYGPPNTLPHLHQQTYRPPPGLSVPSSLQQPIPYPGLSAPPQAAAPNVASSSSLPTTSNNSAMIGFNPPPSGGALNVPNSSSLLLAASNISTAGTSSSLLSLSLPVVPSLQQPLPYSGFIPAQGAILNVPSSSLMPFTTISSSAILGLNTPPAAGSLNVPSSSSPFLAASSSSTALTSSSLSSLSLPAVPSLTAASERSSSSVFNKGLVSVLPSESLNAGLPTLASLTISDSESINPPVSSKVNTVSSSTLPYQNLSQPVSSSTPIEKEMLIPSLVTPDQLLQAEQSHISSQPSQIAHKDVKVVQVSSSSEKSVSVLKEKEVRPPILPLPPAPRPYHKPNGASQVRHNYRGGGRGRGTGASRPVTRFTEDFDFTSMNEKFNKDEVWGHLGKSNKIHSQDKEGDEDDEDGYEDEDGTELPKIEAKPVYNKDDFFDSLSSNALGNEQQNARPKFSEQMKIDTETFGEFARYRGGRGGRSGRGTRHGGRGPNYGRGNGYTGSGGGYGYAGRGRGRGRALSSQAS